MFALLCCPLRLRRIGWRKTKERREGASWPVVWMPSEADACCVGGQSVFHVEQITEVLRAAERGSTAKMTTGITRTSTTTTTAGRATTTRAPEGLPTTASLSIYLSICLSLCPQRLWLPMIVRLRTIVTTNKGTLECIRHRCGRLQRHGAITMKSGPSRGVVPARCFSKDSNNTGNNETLRESVGRIKGDTSDDKDGKGASGGSYTDTGDGSSSGGGDTLRNAASMWQSFSEEVGKTWAELVQSGQRKDINKTIIKPSDTDAGPSTEYTGPLELMVIDESENLTALERMQKRLTEAPIIQGTTSVVSLLLSVLSWLICQSVKFLFPDALCVHRCRLVVVMRRN